mmetsp:Transcript_38851/g.76377  ORF Transcript_38851/g.76377 Transcript_38851/m.76377 type:complete len:146 (-) Transcript_38851:174-611(-)
MSMSVWWFLFFFLPSPSQKPVVLVELNVSKRQTHASSGPWSSGDSILGYSEQTERRIQASNQCSRRKTERKSRGKEGGNHPSWSETRRQAGIWKAKGKTKNKTRQDKPERKAKRYQSDNSLVFSSFYPFSPSFLFFVCPLTVFSP